MNNRVDSIKARIVDLGFVSRKKSQEKRAFVSSPTLTFQIAVQHPFAVQERQRIRHGSVSKSISW